MPRKKTQSDAILERRPSDRSAARTVKQSARQTRTGGVIIRSDRKRAFGWRGPSPGSVSGFPR